MSRILTIEQASEVLQMNPQVVREYLRKGKLPGSKIGRHWRLIEEDLQAYMRSGYTCIPPESVQGKEAVPPNVAEWRSLSSEKRKKRINALHGMFAGSKRTVDDFLREKHEETEAEERRRSNPNGEAA